MTNSRKEFVARLSERTGLKKRTIRDLFNRGWTYSTAIDEPQKWLGPEASFVKPPTVGPKGPAGNSGVVS